MRFRTALALTVLITGAAVATPHGATTSRQHADSLARKISLITQRASTPSKPGASRTLVSEEEVNSWFVYRGRPYFPTGVSNPSVAMLGDGAMRGAATVDLEELGRRKSRGGAFDFWGYLGGKVPVAVTGTLKTEDGRGRFEMQSAELAGLPVPKALVQQLLSAYAADSQGDVSLDATFDLPARIRQIEIQRGQLAVIQ